MSGNRSRDCGTDRRLAVDQCALAYRKLRGHTAKRRNTPGTGNLGVVMFDLHVSRVGSGPLIVASHGVGSSGKVWNDVSPLFPEYEFVTWDQPGHGQSPHLTNPASYGAMTPYDALSQVVQNSLSTRADDRVILFGHSLGGYVSARYAVDHPERVAGLVLIATGPGFRSPDARQKWNDDIIAQADKKNRPEMLVGLHEDSHVMDHLADLCCPTLVMVGADDKAFVGAADYLERKIPNATRVTIEEAGHKAPQTHAVDVAAEIRQFLTDANL
jgi:pimeloyl-ACP methyl ester carboxylesterase